VGGRGGGVTLLDQFIRGNRIDADQLAELAKISKTYLVRLREGRSKPSPHVMNRLAKACSWITCEKVYVWQLFDRV
jgi:transcriptional regulator with XRE-family HTH domain